MLVLLRVLLLPFCFLFFYVSFLVISSGENKAEKWNPQYTINSPGNDLLTKQQWVTYGTSIFSSADGEQAVLCEICVQEYVCVCVCVGGCSSCSLLLTSLISHFSLLNHWGITLIPTLSANTLASQSIKMMIICVWNIAIFCRFSFYVKITAN